MDIISNFSSNFRHAKFWGLISEKLGPEEPTKKFHIKSLTGCKHKWLTLDWICSRWIGLLRLTKNSWKVALKLLFQPMIIARLRYRAIDFKWDIWCKITNDQYLTQHFIWKFQRLENTKMRFWLSKIKVA